MTEPEQTELAGMPEPEQVVPRWLHACEVGGVTFALATLCLATMKTLPGLSEQDQSTLGRAETIMIDAVCRQIGMRAWDEAFAEAVPLYHELMQAARELTIRESGTP